MRVRLAGCALNPRVDKRAMRMATIARSAAVIFHCLLSRLRATSARSRASIPWGPLAVRAAQRLGLTGVAGEADVMKRIHELNLFRAVCFCWPCRFLVD